MKAWKVTSVGLEHSAPDYVIEGCRLGETRLVNKRVLAAWPLQVAEKSWCNVDDFIAQFEIAIEKFKPIGWETIDLNETFRVARQKSREKSRV